MKYLVLSVLCGVAALPANAQAQLQRITRQRPGNGAWDDVDRTVFSRYTAGGQAGLQQQQAWQGGRWQPMQEQRRHHNAAGQLLTDSTFSYTAGLYQPQPTSASAYTYTNGFLAQLLTMERRISPAGLPIWVLASRQAYTYNTGGQCTRILQESASATGLYPSAESLYTYDAQGRVATLEIQTSIGSGYGWEREHKELYTYDAQGNLQLLVIQKSSFNGPYLDQGRQLRQYNAAGQLTVDEGEQWLNGAWEPSSRQLYTYDAQGNPLTLTYQGWSRGSSAYHDNSRSVYSYVGVSSVAREGVMSVLQLGPNPATEATTLRYELPAPVGAATVEVLNAQGRRVAEQPAASTAGAHALPLATSGWPVGLYMVRLRTGGRVLGQARLLVP